MSKDTQSDEKAATIDIRKAQAGEECLLTFTENELSISVVEFDDFVAVISLKDQKNKDQIPMSAQELFENVNVELVLDITDAFLFAHLILQDWIDEPTPLNDYSSVTVDDENAPITTLDGRPYNQEDERDQRENFQRIVDNGTYVPIETMVAVIAMTMSNRNRQ